MKQARFIWRWLQISLATVAMCAALWLAAQYMFGLRLLAVQTGSMEPVFRPGDALIMQKAGLASIKVGQIVSYKSPRNPRELITHRVVAIDYQRQRFQTKGDRLSVADPPVRAGLLVGKVINILPGLGGVLTWLHSWPALVLCVYIPGIAIGLSELLRLERYMHRWLPYQLPGRQVL